MRRSLAVIIALLAAVVPANAQRDAPSTSGRVHLPQPMRVEGPRGLHDDRADEDDHTLFLPLIHGGPSDYPLHPPQIEPGVGETFPCGSCPDGVSKWLLLDHHIEYEVVGEIPWCDPFCDLEPGDVVIEVTARIRNDSEVDYWAWMGGSSYDDEGNFLTGTIYESSPPFPNTQLVHAHETGDFTFHLKSDRAIAVLCLGVSWSVIPPP